MTTLALPRPARFGLKQLMAVFVALATIGATFTIATSEAEARNRNRGAILAFTAVGALALGAIALGQANANNRGPVYQDDVYYHPQPRRPIPRYYDAGYAARFGDDVYVAPRQRCRIRVIRTYDDEGNTYRQRVRVCR